MLITEPNPLPAMEALELAHAHALEKANTTIVSLTHQNTVLLAENALLKEQLLLLQKKQFGKSSEQSKESDLDLTHSIDLTNSAAGTTAVSGYTRRRKNSKPRGKNTDLSHLPHFQILHDLPDDRKCCADCNKPLMLIGKDSTKKLEVLPQRLYVAEHLCCKYTCRDCDTIIEAKKEPCAIPKGLGGDSLIVEILENKYQYHLPLYRQSMMLKNYGAAISDITLGNWVSHVGEGLLPLYDALWNVMLDARYTQIDETPIKILRPEKQGYLWTYFSPLIGKGLVLFEASLTRSGEVAKKRLESYNGLIQTDGYNGYQSLRKRKGIIALGCLSHARRKFKEVVDISQDTEGIAAQVIKQLKPLYALEETMRQGNYPFRVRKKFRKKIAKPTLICLHKWLLKQVPLVPPKSKLGQAISYTLNQWPYLIAYVKHGWAQIDTNWVENQIRPIALGKKNWMFMGHEDSAKIHALFYSLILSASLNDLNPRLYLHFLLSKVHELRQKKISAHSLLPHLIDKSLLKAFAHTQLQQAKTILNSFK